MSASVLDPEPGPGGPWTPAAGQRHRWLSFQLCVALNRAAPAGWRAQENINLRVAENRILIPDLTVLATRDMSGPVAAVADARLVAEITSPGNAFVDRAMKPSLYAQAGIPHYLRVELADGAPTALVFALQDDAYVETARFAPGETTVLGSPFPVRFDLAALIDS